MNRFHMCLALVTAALFQLSTAAFAGPVDNYYLQQFGETKTIQLEKALLSEAPATQDSAARCGMPLKHGLRRDWNLLEPSTQKVLAKQLAAPALANERTFTSAANHFKVHYTTVGADAPPLADANNNGVPDWVETVATTFENVYTYYGSQGYRPAPTNPAGTPYNLYLLDLAPQRYYGTTTSDQPALPANYANSYTSWMELDNNFTDDIYNPGTYPPLQSLQITAAHEYHHAVQYGYNIYFEVWYAEATSTWMEDEVYDNVNQLYTYIPAWFRYSTSSLDLAVGSDAVTTGAGYGRWIFNRYLAEKHTPIVVRSFWETLAGLDPRTSSVNSNGDILMTPVLESVLSSGTYGTSLSADFFAFAKRVYKRDWATHTTETSKIHVYTPVASYAAYPVSSSNTPAPSITLPHYSFAYYKFTPAAGVPSLTITIAKSSGIQTAVFKKSSGTITEIIANSGGTSYTDSTFSSSDELVLLIANTTSSDGQNANFSTDGNLVPTTEPPATTSSTTSGNKSGCFIATAAYGSYLHPQVQLLRQFRDEYLLTNAPGRAFVSLYYRFSPQLADVIARHSVLRSIARLLLTPLVVVVVHPLISAVSLFLLVGTALLLRLRRVAHMNITSNTLPGYKRETT
ncbi:MAG: MXAN_6640 family putative metalloprotease [Pelobacteraceae bacterium]